MAYTDDAVLAKMSALNETQESIVTVAQWVMFHKRHAEKTAGLWFQRLKDSGSGKRLNLIYLANEVVQQSKSRRKDDFLLAFSPVIVEAVAVSYRGATNEVQQKLRRVIEVWRQRQIFELPVQETLEARVDELDKSRSSGKKSLLGGSLLGSASSTPAELQPLIPLQTTVSKLATPKTTVIANANHEFDKLSDSAIPTPTPPVQAARLSGVLNSLANAEGAVAESIKARHSLIEGLKKLLDSNQSILREEESSLYDLGSRKTTVEAKKREVEDEIMRGLADEAPLSPSAADDTTPRDERGVFPGESSTARQSRSSEPERPATEELTPPSVENLTPTGSPPPEPVVTSTTTGADIIHEKQPADNESAPTSLPPLVPAAGAADAAPDLLSTLSMPQVRHSSGSPSINGSTTKRRKIDNDVEGFFDLAGENAMDGLDDDVAEMLRQDSGGLKRG
ncbi:MAG: hypothetical protein M1837_003995 [Sclerophora amabilis]|nr:MAG: hypothetical protein M1837_003995 [Sclerophora amabilis]